MNDELDEYIIKDRFTGEHVKYVRRVCECGHTVYFLENKPMMCRHCNRTIYPTNRYQFKDKVAKLKRKKEKESE